MKSFHVFKCFGLALSIGLLVFPLAGFAQNNNGEQTQPAGYPIASDVFTTREKTVIPDPRPSVMVLLDEVSKYDHYGFGTWKYGKGIDDGKRIEGKRIP